MTSAYRAERIALRDTIASLSDDELMTGTTLCTEWAPRDVMAHLLGIDASLPTYLKKGGRIQAANAEIVAKHKAMSADQLRSAIDAWAQKPARHSLLAASFLLGDLGIHHQDILRGLGRTREVPSAIGAAIMREGIVLGGWLKLRSFRVVPTDGGRSIGRGKVVRGTKEALGMWLSGRGAVESELAFQ